MVEKILLLLNVVKNYGFLIVVCKLVFEELFEGGYEFYFRLFYLYMEISIFNFLLFDIKYSYVFVKILMKNILKLVLNYYSGRIYIFSYMLKMVFFI